MKMRKRPREPLERKKERKKERRCCSLFLINTRKKEDDSTKCVNGSPITIQKTDKNTERNLWMKKVRKIILYDKK